MRNGKISTVIRLYYMFFISILKLSISKPFTHLHPATSTFTQLISASTQLSAIPSTLIEPKYCTWLGNFPKFPKIWTAPIITSWNFLKNKAVLLKWFDNLNLLEYFSCHHTMREIFSKIRLFVSMTWKFDLALLSQANFL